MAATLSELAVETEAGVMRPPINLSWEKVASQVRSGS
jgi:hypothetical protein